jgi:hypothetical protein
MDGEVAARGDVGADVDSIGVAKDALLFWITWLCGAVESKVAWALTTCSHKQAVFRM